MGLVKYQVFGHLASQVLQSQLQPTRPLLVPTFSRHIRQDSIASILGQSEDGPSSKFQMPGQAFWRPWIKAVELRGAGVAKSNVTDVIPHGSYLHIVDFLPGQRELKW